MTTQLDVQGRRTIAYQTNKSGGSVAKGDVVIGDSSNDDAFTTTTTGAIISAAVGVVIEDNGIANNALGRVAYEGYVDLVNVNASVTRGHFGKTHTVVKQAADAGASRVTGVFCVFTTGGTSPHAILFGMPDGSTGAAGSPGTPALTLSTTNSTGAAATLVATDATIAAFDATAPVTQAFGDSATAGSAGVAARRDHKHGMPAAVSVAAAAYLRTAGNYTTTSTSFVNVDNTNLALTITTGAHRCLVGLSGGVSHSNVAGYTAFDVELDGARIGVGTSDVGLLAINAAVSTELLDCSFTYLTEVLSAGSHTFKLQWVTSGATATLAGSDAAGKSRFWVLETLATA